MKALVLAGNQELLYQDIEEPRTSSGCVKIKVAYCGICGSDIPRVFDHAVRSYPLVLGHEFSGVVQEIGDDVKNVAVGDHVVVVPLIPCYQCNDCIRGDYALCKNYSFIGSRQQGGMAEYVVVPAQNAVKIPDNMSLEQAATIEPATVALHAFRKAKFESGKSVAVLGCGIIGLYIVQWAKELGASHISVISRGQEGLRASKELGADLQFSTQVYSNEEILRKTLSSGYDYVFESSGSEQTMQLALSLVTKKGTVCLVGTPKKPLNFSVKQWENLNRKECWLTGTWMSYSLPFPGEEWSTTVKHMAYGRLKYHSQLVWRIYAMRDAAAAFQIVKNSLAKGRILLKNDG